METALIDDEAQLRRRILEVIRSTTQASVARRTGTPQTSLSRYLKNRKIPAEFCVRLVKALGVSPSWLLSGEGPVYATELSAQAHDAAQTLLELTAAMSATLRSQTAGITGNPSAKLLRELAVRAGELDSLHGRLLERVRPVFSRLLADLDAAYYEGKGTEAAALLASLKQVSRLGRDADMEDRLDEANAFRENQQGNFAGAIAIRSRLFRRALLRRESSCAEWCELDSNYLANLFHCFRLKEARRAARLLLAMHANERHLPEYHALRFHAAYLDFELGNPRGGWSRMLSARARAPATQRQFFIVPLIACQLATGVITTREACTVAATKLQDSVQPMRASIARTIARAALWLETKEAVTGAVEHLDAALDDAEDHGFHLLAFHIRAVAERLAGRKPLDLRAYLAEPLVQESLASAEHRVRFTALVYATQMARVCADSEAAILARESQECLTAMAPEYTPWLTLRALHFRNLFFVDESAGEGSIRLRRCAEGFFRKCRKAGYHEIARSVQSVRP